MLKASTFATAVLLVAPVLARPYGSPDSALAQREVFTGEYLPSGALSRAEPAVRFAREYDSASGGISLGKFKIGPICARGWKRCCGVCPLISPGIATNLFSTAKTAREARSMEALD